MNDVNRQIVDFAMADNPAELGRVFSTAMIDKVKDALSGHREQIARGALGADHEVYDAQSGESTADNNEEDATSEDESA